MKFKYLFNRSWWAYIFEKPYNLTKIWCRTKDHPKGYVWISPGNIEPDFHCKNCGDFLG